MEEIVTLAGFLFIVGIITLAGFGFILNGVKRYKQRNQIQNTERVTPKYLTQGTYQVEGTVEPSQDPIPTLTSGEPAVIVDYSIISNSSLDDRDYHGSKTIARDFYLDGNQEKVLVDTDTFELRLSDLHEETITVDVEEEGQIPDQIKAFEDETGEKPTEVRHFDDKFSMNYRHKYEETALIEGDEVMISGEVVPIQETDKEDANATHVLRSPESGPKMFITDEEGETRITGVKGLAFVAGEILIGLGIAIVGSFLTLGFALSIWEVIF